MLLRRFESIEKTDNGYLVKGDSAFAKIIFLTDDIIRIRVSFDGKFRESSYALVTTAWDDDLDEFIAFFQKIKDRIFGIRSHRK